METRNGRLLFRGLVINIEQLEVKVGAKGWHTYQIVRHPGGVGVLPLHDDDSVTLIRQLRPAADAFLLEIPAGRLAPGEDPNHCGARELLEETGLVAELLEPLGQLFSSPGVFDEKIYLFLGTGLLQGESAQEVYEDIETVRLPLTEALAMAMDGRISDSKTIVALFRAAGRVR
jgi:ADP-ribose pyrophosphatase